MPKYALIVTAAGKSERFTGDKSPRRMEKKPFAKLNGRPILFHTLERFVNRDDVCQILVTVPKEDIERIKSSYGPNFAFMNATLVKGGARRCDSVANALEHVAEDAEYIAVHDAVRPCVTSKMIDDVFAEAVKSGAAILAAPINGTIKRVSEDMVIDETVPRISLFESQTPQVFRKDILVKAYAGLPDVQDETEVTDDAQLVERMGQAVTVVACDSSNLKITSPAELPLATAIIKSRPKKRVPKLGAFEEAQW